MPAYSPGGGGGRAVDLVDSDQLTFDQPFEIIGNFTPETAAQINEMFSILFKAGRRIEDSTKTAASTGAVGQVSIELTFSQIANLNSTPISFLAAQGAGIVAVPLHWTFEQQLGAQTFSVTVPAMRVRYSGLSSDLCGGISIKNTANLYYRQHQIASGVTALGNDVNPANTAIVLTSTADAAQGSGTFTATLVYYLVTNS
jgi:hypothetical protein